MDVSSLYQCRPIVSVWFSFIPPDTWKGLKCQIDASDVFGAEVSALITAETSPSFVFLRRPRPPQRLTLPSVIHSCQLLAIIILLRSRWWPIRLFDKPASLSPTYYLTTIYTAADYVSESSLVTKPCFQVVRFVWIALRYEHLCF